MRPDVKDMRLTTRSNVVAASAGAAAAVVLCLTACGRGPVEPIGFAGGASITLELFVSGQIAPSEGDYLIVLNENTGSAPNFVNLNTGTGEQPGEATILEGYGLNPPPFTHWDQAFVYGSTPNGLPNCSPAPANSFFYCYKAVTQNGGGITIKFVPIIMTPNTFTFNPAGNGGSGTGNAIILRIPLSCLSIFAGADSSSCDSVTPQVTQIYVNFITLDTTGTPQDQLACNAGQTFIIDVTTSTTQQLTKPTNCQTQPSNQDLLITGGLVQVNVP